MCLGKVLCQANGTCSGRRGLRDLTALLDFPLEETDEDLR